MFGSLCHFAIAVTPYTIWDSTDQNRKRIFYYGWKDAIRVRVGSRRNIEQGMAAGRPVLVHQAARGFRGGS